MSSSNRGMTVIIIIAVVLILGVRYFLSNREVVTEDDVRDKIEVAVDATQTAIIVRTTTAPTESNSAGNSIRNQGITEAVNSTIAAQETRIADLLATRDALAAATAYVPPTLTPTERSASNTIRVQRTADALLLRIDEQKTQIAALQTTIEAQEEPTIVPSRTPIPTMVDNTEIPTVTTVQPTSISTIENTAIPATSAPTTVPQVFQSADYPNVVRHQSWLTSEVMAIAPDNTRILTTSNLNATYLYDVNTGEVLHELIGIFAAESAAAWSPDSQFMAVGDVNGVVMVWDSATGEGVFGSSNDTGVVQKLAWSPDGMYLATISEFELTIWNAANWEQVYSEQVISGVSLAWSPDSQSLLYADTLTISRVSLTDTVVNIGIWMTHDAEIVDMDWSPDGQRLAMVDELQRVNVYNVTDSILVYSMRGHRDTINSVQWAADSVYILTASDDKTVRIWNGSTGSATFVLEINDEFDYLLSQANWTSDGQFIVINASDILFWSNPLMNGAVVEEE
jgi:dipeptidyl aminopeptidase/acylaminoacyl peptidase